MCSFLALKLLSFFYVCRDQALAQYRQAVASAFADVRNALSAQATARLVLASESARGKALTQAYQQAELRYKAEISSRMELLDVERNYLQAELNRLDAERAQRAAPDATQAAQGQKP